MASYPIETVNTSPHASEVSDGERFRFGANWTLFLRQLDGDRIERARTSLCRMLGVSSLEGKRFLDVGSGSGVFSLAARQLGARVHSFDYDPASVACTAELKRRYFPADPLWVVGEGSVLDEEFVRTLPACDIVYSWGVLHHTGAMWSALSHVAALVRPGGTLFIAIYNDQGRASGTWLKVKRLYNRLPNSLRWLVLMPALIRLWGPTILRDLLRGRPFETWQRYGENEARGMDPWRDVVDWVGGLPFEVAKPEQIFEFGRNRGLRLERLVTCAGGHGCNEYVFSRASEGGSAEA